MTMAAAVLISGIAHAGPERVVSIRMENNLGVVSVRDAFVTMAYPDRAAVDRRSGPLDAPYKVRILGCNGRIFTERPFSFDRTIMVPPGPDGSPARRFFQPRPSLSVNIPYPGDAESVLVIGPGLREEIRLEGLRMEQPAPAESEIVYQGCPDEATCLKLLFISDGFTQSDMDSFHRVVTLTAGFIFDVEPYASIMNRTNIYRLDNYTDLGCFYNCGGIARAICCDDWAVLSVASTVPHDEVVVIVNSNEWGGTATLDWGSCFDPDSYAITNKNLLVGAIEAVIHETGHSMGGLWDEYEYGYEGHRGGEGPNCTRDSTCKKWAGTPGTGCFKGCTYDNYYRPTKDECLMRSSQMSGLLSYCPVCLNHFMDKIERCVPAGDCHAPPDECHVPYGRLENSACVYDPRPKGASCDDGDACAEDDVCDGQGTCNGTAITCDEPPDIFCWVSPGTCSNGACGYSPKPAGSPCHDGYSCTINDVCDGKGVCEGVPDPACQDGGFRDTGGPDAETPDVPLPDMGATPWFDVYGGGGEVDGGSGEDAAGCSCAVLGVEG